MNDATRLRQLMAEYQQTLVRHHQALTDAHLVLDRRYEALAAVYEGVRAAEFKAGWARATAAFQGYAEGVPPLKTLLAEKMDQLASFDLGD